MGSESIEQYVPDLVGAGFRITGGKGFHVTFDNGWTVSVQFSHYNYCKHYIEWPSSTIPEFADFGPSEENSRAVAEKGSPDAEVAIWNEENEWATGDDGYSQVYPRQTPADVLKTMQAVARMERGDDADQLRIIRDPEGHVVRTERAARQHDEEGEGDV